jgi:predicted DNA-binding transcriptional regulator AlpA
MLRLISMKELPGIIGLSRATIYQLLAAGEFIPPVQLTPSRRAWRSDLVEQWINDRPVVSPRKENKGDLHE